DRIDLVRFQFVQEGGIAHGRGRGCRWHETAEQEQHGPDDHYPDQHLACHVIHYKDSSRGPRYTIEGPVASKQDTSPGALSGACNPSDGPAWKECSNGHRSRIMGALPAASSAQGRITPASSSLP